MSDTARKACYVLGDNGRFYVQVDDATSRWGFYLTDGEGSYDGAFGSGIKKDWEVVADAEVPEAVREEMDWIFDEVAESCAREEALAEAYASGLVY